MLEGILCGPRDYREEVVSVIFSYMKDENTAETSNKISAQHLQHIHHKQDPSLDKLSVAGNMSTPVQKNLIEKNNEYAQHFKLGDLAAPPAKQYAVCTLTPPIPWKPRHPNFSENGAHGPP